MRVFFGIAVSVMHPVKDGVCPGIKERRSLRDKCKEVKKALPGFTHAEHFVGGVPVQKEGLAKKRKEPMCQEETEDVHFR
jgi:hypothetical protein